MPRLLICPADTARETAPTFSLLQNSNVSYFVGVYADYNLPESALAGDRNITNDARATASLVRGIYGLRWTSELHSFKGNVLYSDAHVEELNNTHMQLQAGTSPGSVFFLPAVRPTTALAWAPPPSSTVPTPAAPVASPPPAPLAGSPGSAPANVPPQSPPGPAMRGMSSSRMTATERSAEPAIFTTDAKETNGVAVTNSAQPAAAPETYDDEVPPLLWLLGAAKALLAKASWWLLLLLMLLIAMALYFYSRRKMRDRRPRKSG
jgi:prepilin-type processing-associated H-X9-DG protein